MTGYNGVLGYRTDGAYKTKKNLQDDQKAFLKANPDFDYDKEVKAAKKVAKAMKKDGGNLQAIPGVTETLQAPQQRS